MHAPSQRYLADLDYEDHNRASPQREVCGGMANVAMHQKGIEGEFTDYLLCHDIKTAVFM